jgi:hypothetical protein
MLQLTETQKNQTYEISLKSNGIVVGSFVKVDGFFYFSPPQDRFRGFYSEEFLKSLTNELEKLNYTLNKSIDEYFELQT